MYIYVYTFMYMYIYIYLYTQICDAHCQFRRYHFLTVLLVFVRACFFMQIADIMREVVPKDPRAEKATLIANSIGTNPLLCYCLFFYFFWSDRRLHERSCSEEFERGNSDADREFCCHHSLTM